MADTTSTILDRTQIFNFQYATTGSHKNAHRVRIVQNTNRLSSVAGNEVVSIDGYLRDPINFDMAARWEPKEGFVSGLLSSELANTVLNPLSRIGFGAAHAGYITKKYYSGGTDLILSINMRITDEYGTGEIVETVAKLAGLMLPAQKGEISLANMLPDQVASTKAAAKEYEKSGTGFGPLDKIGTAEMVSNAVDEMVDAGITTTASPVPVILYVGEYFVNYDMIINSCSVSFSKELVEVKKMSEKSSSDGKTSEQTVVTYHSPLYADVTLGMASRENLYLTEGKNAAKGTVINSTLWGIDARNSLAVQEEAIKR